MPGDVAQAGQGPALARLFTRLSTVVEGIRISGAIAYDLAAMALGEVHGRVSFAPKPVDVAAALSIVAAISGIATDLDGRPYTLDAGPIVVGASAEIHAALLEAARASVE
jgi:myo-inositol-1(or 4)-monophosphatase